MCVYYTRVIFDRDVCFTPVQNKNVHVIFRGRIYKTYNTFIIIICCIDDRNLRAPIDFESSFSAAGINAKKRLLRRNII